MIGVENMKMLNPERAPRQHWIWTRPGRLELAGYAAAVVIIFILVYSFLR
jgi:hypothetical protein